MMFWKKKKKARRKPVKKRPAVSKRKAVPRKKPTIKKSAKKSPLTKLHKWLESLRTDDGKKYLHILLTELSNIPDAVWEELLVYIDHAHEGARSSLRAPRGSPSGSQRPL